MYMTGLLFCPGVRTDTFSYLKIYNFFFRQLPHDFFCNG